MKREGHWETEVRGSFGLDKLWILYQSCITLRLILELRWSKFWSYRASAVNLEAVVELQNQSKLRSEDDTCLAMVFFQFQLSKGIVVEVPHLVLAVFS